VVWASSDIIGPDWKVRASGVNAAAGGCICLDDDAAGLLL